MKNLLWMIPLAIFVLLLIIRLIIAPYTIDKKRKQKIKELQDELAATQKQSFATPDALTSTTLQNMSVRISDLVREDFTIRNKTFDNCHIYGPAVIQLSKKGTMVRNTFAEVVIDSALIETPNNFVSGVIRLENFIIQDCTLHNIGFIGSPEVIKQLREKFLKNK